METIHLPVVDNSTHKIRLDKFLSNELPEISRSRLEKLIAEGNVTLRGKPMVKASHKTKVGDKYIVIVPETKELKAIAQNIPLEILYEDDHLIVINKSADMAVHPAVGTPDGTVVNALLHHCKGKLASIGGVERPGIVHRLDKGTSGVMVIAKDDKTHQSLCEQFGNRTIKRFYLALVYGKPVPERGQIETQLGRHPKDRKKMAVLQSGGKTAITNYEIVEEYSNASLVRCKLLTGRTHQIRVHMVHLGNAIIGDPVYGRARNLANATKENNAIVKSADHQMLHAAVLGFTHPITGKELEFESPMPADMLAVQKAVSE